MASAGFGLDRYIVISADCHGGGELHQYRDYLPSGYHEEFDAWAATYEVPFEDLEGPDADRNWSSSRRLREMEEDGIVAEVIYPNTVPPFFPEVSLTNQPPPAGSHDLELRWAGLQAHNRWLADFCADTPGRRAGIVQIMLDDVDAAVDEIRWAREAGLTGGVLLPGAPPGSGLPPLFAPDYEPIWSVCEELGMPVNHHSGSAAPDYGDHRESKVMFLIEVTWYAHRALWELIYSGVLERHPGMELVLTEQGTAWIPQQLQVLDYFYERMRSAVGSQEYEWGHEIVADLSLKPSEYWARQCHVGASFIRPAEVPLRGVVGVDRIMWGSDYPHKEASFPFSKEAIQLSFSDVEPDEVQAMLGGNAAEVYGFDLDALAPVAAEVGPRIEEVAEPLRDFPAEAGKCPAFAGLTSAGSKQG